MAALKPRDVGKYAAAVLQVRAAPSHSRHTFGTRVLRELWYPGLTPVLGHRCAAAIIRRPLGAEGVAPSSPGTGEILLLSH